MDSCYVPRSTLKSTLVIGSIIGVAIFMALGYFGTVKCGFVTETYGQMIMVVLVLGPLCIFGESLIEGLFQDIFRSGWFRIGRFVVNHAFFGRIEIVGGKPKVPFPWHGVKRANGGALTVSRNFVRIIGCIVILGSLLLGAFLIVSVIEADSIQPSTDAPSCFATND